MPKLLPGLLLAMLGSLAPSLRAQCSNPLLPGVGYPGLDGPVAAIERWDPDGPGPLAARLVVGGGFTRAGTMLASNIAAFDPGTGQWSAFGAGANGSVTALLALPNGDLVAGGSFTTAGGLACQRIARWDGTSWNPLGSGIAGLGGLIAADVRALALAPNGDLVVGGQFTIAGGLPCNAIARWDGSSWSGFGNGATPSAGSSFPAIEALARVANGDLIATGNFAAIAGVPATGIARFDGNSWTAMGNMAGQPFFGGYSLTELANGNLVVGGGFSSIGVVAAENVAQWNGSTWSPIGPGIAGIVHEVLTDGAGQLFAIGGQTQFTVQRWSGTAWSAVGNLQALQLGRMPNGDLVAGGAGLRRWTGTAWVTLSGISDPVSALAFAANGELLIGGWFPSATGTVMNGVARRSGGAWLPLGSGPLTLPDEIVTGLLALPNGDVIAVGTFTARNRIARWNGATWQSLGGGLAGGAFPMAKSVIQLTSGDLVVVGRFTTAGGIAATNIARWSGTAWSPLGSGLNGPANTLVQLPNGDVLVGGSFSASGGVPAGCLARWNGSTWSAFGGTGATGAFDSIRYIVMTANGDIVVGGEFTSIGGVAAAGLARWNGTNWSPLGQAPAVSAMTSLPNGDLVVGGSSFAPPFLSRWDGNAWTALGPNLTVDGYVEALAVAPDGELVVGGTFSTSAPVVTAHLLEVTTSCPAIANALGTGCVGSGGTNVLTATSLPWLGATFVGTATGMPAGGLAIDAFGLSTASIPMGAILPQGVAGCTLSISPDLLDFSAVSGNTAIMQLAIPNTATLVNQVLFAQVAPLEIGPAGIVALTATNALRLQIGRF
ncbi:MAG: hypothetical protein MUC36_07420 [Planctomycetes bacterium]|nr:hypothetical protein [Planctomycetota bacterium]